MFNTISFLGIVPARGGSVRLPRKNLLELNGEPLIASSIKAGLKSKYIDEVIVSTDDGEIIEAAKQFGAEVPFRRPQDLAQDETKTIDVILHALKSLAKGGKNFEYLVLLQPTSPFRSARHIDAAVEIVCNENLDGIVGVTELEHPVEWANILPPNYSMDKFFCSGNYELRSQEFPTRYRINGAIYICRISRILDEETIFFSSNTKAFVMDRKSSIDIDTEFDYKIAGCLSRIR